VTTRYATRQPARTSSVLAVAVAAAVVVALSGARPSVGQWVLVELLGLGAVVAGVIGYRSGRQAVGVAVALVGCLVCVGAIGGFVAGSPTLSETLRLLPGFLGLAVLTAALVGEGSRALVKAGTGGLFAAVLLAGLFQAGELTLLLGTAVGAIVAWDAGEHAIGVGEHLGTQASTWRCELPHIAATALVGFVGAIAIFVVRGVANDGLSLPTFAMVFVAMVLLVVALRW